MGILILQILVLHAWIIVNFVQKSIFVNIVKKDSYLQMDNAPLNALGQMI